ncbi:hypothetical protein [Bosea massiliensis]|uniref:ABM domain-containing protein n=1 Tax=Bosea massiliensis TaxID=151419 RepID=A0ABW0P3C2_9HYPH
MRTLADTAYSLRLHQDDPMKGILFELHVHEDTEEGVAFLDQFREACFENLGAAPAGKPIPPGAESVHWYLQGQSSEWLMFEFWSRDIPAIRRAVARVENALRTAGVTVTIEDRLSQHEAA